MFELLVEPARRIRHMLDAWLLLAACILCCFLPFAGLPIGLALGGLGAIASLRLGGYGKTLHCIVLLCLFSLAAAVLIVGNAALLLRAALSGSYPPASGPKVEGLPNVARLPLAVEASPSGPIPDPTPAQLLRQPAAPDVRATPQVRANSPDPANRDRFAEAKASAFAWLGARNAMDISRASGICDETVEISGVRIARSQLSQETPKADPTYATEVEEVTGEPYVVPISADDSLWRVTAHASFVRRSADAGMRWRGQRYRTIILRDDGSAFRIAGDSHKDLPLLKDPAQRIAETDAHRIRALLAHCLQADLSGDFDSSAACYAPETVYYGRVRSPPELAAGKRAYASRWPRRWENFDTALRLEALPDGRILAQFAGRSRTESPERGEWTTGYVQHRFVVSPAGGGLVIEEQSGKVLEPKKGTLERN